MTWTLQVSIWLIVGTTVVLTAWDFVPAFFTDEPGDTLSEVIYTWSREWIILPWIWGVLGGHFFTGAPAHTFDKQTDVAVLLWLTWIVFIVDLSVDRPPMFVYFIVLLSGVVAGYLFWSLSA